MYPEEEKEMVFREIPDSVCKTFKRNDVIINEGEALEYIYYLVDGEASRIMINDEGEKFCLDVKVGDDGINSILGLYFVYGTNEENYSPVLFVANTDCICYQISIQDYLEWTSNRNDILQDTIYYFVNDSIKTMQYFKHSQKKETTREVCEFLLTHSVKSGEKYVVPKQFKLKNLAATIGVHKVTVSRIMNALKEKK